MSVFTPSQCVDEERLVRYNKEEAYAKVVSACGELTWNLRGDPVHRTIILIYYRSFAHLCELDKITLEHSLIGSEGAKIIAYGLKISIKITSLDLRKQTPSDYNNRLTNR